MEVKLTPLPTSFAKKDGEEDGPFSGRFESSLHLRCFLAQGKGFCSSDAFKSICETLACKPLRIQRGDSLISTLKLRLENHTVKESDQNQKGCILEIESLPARTSSSTAVARNKTPTKHGTPRGTGGSIPSTLSTRVPLVSVGLETLISLGMMRHEDISHLAKGDEALVIEDLTRSNSSFLVKACALESPYTVAQWDSITATVTCSANSIMKGNQLPLLLHGPGIRNCFETWLSLLQGRITCSEFTCSLPLRNGAWLLFSLTCSNRNATTHDTDAAQSLIGRIHKQTEIKLNKEPQLFLQNTPSTLSQHKTKPRVFENLLIKDNKYLARVIETAFLPQKSFSASWLQPKVIVVYGRGGSGKCTTLAAIAKNLGLSLEVVIPYEKEFLLDSIERLQREHPECCVYLVPHADIHFASNLEGEGLRNLFHLLSGLESQQSDRSLRRRIIVFTTSRIRSVHASLLQGCDDVIEIASHSPETRLTLMRELSQNCIFPKECDLPILAQMTKSLSQADILRFLSLIHDPPTKDSSFRISLDKIRSALTSFGIDLPSHISASSSSSTSSSYSSITLSSARDATLQKPVASLFDSIVGQESVKAQLSKYVLPFFTNSVACKSLGLRSIKGVLFFGPPGCGKTTFVHSVCEAINARMIEIQMHELLLSEVGESEKKIAEFFEKAALITPCVVFIKDIDVLFSSRDDSEGDTLMVSQLSYQFEQLAEGVVVVCTSSCPQSLDRALLRHGRIHQALYVTHPTVEDRVAMLRRFILPLMFDEDVGLEKYASSLPEDCSGGDLKNLARMAVLHASRRGLHTSVGEEDMDAVFSRYKCPRPQISHEQYLAWVNEINL